MNKLIQYFTNKPKQLLLIDSIGAGMTALSLFAIIRPWSTYFGMPEKELTVLTGLAFCFCIYSAVCFLRVKSGFSPFIRFIGMANVLYCVLTGGLIITYYLQLTNIGIAWFLTEIVIIGGLSYVEFQVAKRIV
jgi:hypothetical protein